MSAARRRTLAAALAAAALLAGCAQSGPPIHPAPLLATAARSTPVAQTTVFDVRTAAADAEVARIIAAHGGPAARAGAQAARH